MHPPTMRAGTTSTARSATSRLSETLPDGRAFLCSGGAPSRLCTANITPVILYPIMLTLRRTIAPGNELRGPVSATSVTVR
jgi:hypothetical protein